MNSRIKELMEQAVIDVDVVTGNETLDDELAKMYIPDCFAKKFAELIVRECLDEIEFQYGGGRETEDGTHSKDWDAAVECLSAMVRHRFGIKE